jgi:hypothetical protein
MKPRRPQQKPSAKVLDLEAYRKARQPQPPKHRLHDQIKRNHPSLTDEEIREHLKAWGEE